MLSAASIRTILTLALPLIASLAITRDLQALPLLQESAPPPAVPSAEPPLPPPSPENDEPAVDPAATDAPQLPKTLDIFDAAKQHFGESEKVASIESFALTAQMIGPLGDLAFGVQSHRSGAFRFIQTTNGRPSAVVVYDGKIAWTMASDGKFELLEEAALQQAVQQFEMMFPLWFALAPTQVFQEIGEVERATFRDIECFRIKLAKPVSRIAERFGLFDESDRRLRGISVISPNNPDIAPVDFVFSEWKEFEGVNFFTTVVIHQPAQQLTLTYQNITFNDVDASVFEQPTEVKKLLEQNATATTEGADDEKAEEQGNTPTSTDPSSDDDNR